MGCLFELLFEVVFELIVEVVGTLYMKLMMLIVPEHQFSERLQKRIKNGVTVFAVLLFLCAFIGFFMFIQPPSTTKTVGAYLLFVPLGIMGVQTLAGIIYRIIRTIKKRR
ncbi:MAG: hypothetical protein IJW49_02110 [Clostridia bacterium]|nr:hypothetical protein [Clostridia bacterium]